MQGFRISVVCLAAAAIGAAWWWQIGWLFVLALVIGGEELLESTIVIAALKHGHADVEGAAPAAPSQSGTSQGLLQGNALRRPRGSAALHNALN